MGALTFGWMIQARLCGKHHMSMLSTPKIYIVINKIRKNIQQKSKKINRYSRDYSATCVALLYSGHTTLQKQSTTLEENQSPLELT